MAGWGQSPPLCKGGHLTGGLVSDLNTNLFHAVILHDYRVLSRDENTALFMPLRLQFAHEKIIVADCADHHPCL